MYCRPVGKRKMRVLFDHQAFCMQTHGGVSRCFMELYKHLPNDIQARIALRECNNAYVRECGIAPSESSEYYNWIIKGNWPAKGRLFNVYYSLLGYKNGAYWDKMRFNQYESIRQLSQGDFDIFHPTFLFDYFLPYLNGKPFVLTIHDMIPELYPQYYDAVHDPQILGKRKLAPLAGAIVVVSEKTKEDVVCLLKVPEEKVHVIYHGSSLSVPETVASTYDFPYILYVGERSMYKNFGLFVEQMASVLICHPELKIVCTGLSFSEKEIAMLEKYGIRDHFIQHWVKSDAELYSLYHYAVCFVYTSEYEGFGIPILEAYQAGCPVLLNNASCFPEVAGDAAIYFELNESSSNIAQVFEDFYHEDPCEIESLKVRQYARLQRYSWENAAQKLSSVYRQVLETSK